MPLDGAALLIFSISRLKKKIFAQAVLALSTPLQR
jgi:hypothetical protein